MDIYVFINNERKSLRQLSAETGVAYETIYARWKNGVPADKLVELPEPEEPELPLTKEEVVNALGYTPGMVNPNLLDNWYFANPVNQRGQTTYASGENVMYTIDRWLIGWNATLSVDESGAIFTRGGEIAQFIEPTIIDYIEGKTVTLSFLSRSGELRTSTGVVSGGTLTSVEDIQLRPWAGTGIALMMYLSNPLAAKLELGDAQTLAHLDEAGNWVINEIPNHHEERLKCIQSTADPNDGYANKVVAATDQTLSMDLLWQNASLGSSFGAQTISLDLSSYQQILLIVIHATSDKTDCDCRIITAPGGAYIHTFSGGAEIWRTVKVSETGVTFSASSNNNGLCIPKLIYGIKGVT